MKLIPTKLAGVSLIERVPHADKRGFFARIFCEAEFSAGDRPFHISQINTSWNEKAFTLRGLHWKDAPEAEGKIIYVVRGKIFDVAVDLRPSSETFGKWFGVNLDARSGAGLHIPEGCAHGFLTLEPDTEVLYFMNRPHIAGFDRGAKWNDPALGIAWPHAPEVISEKDEQWPELNLSGLA